MRTAVFLLAGGFVLGLVGCNGNAQKGGDPLEQKVERLVSERQELAEDLAAARAENERLTGQLATLAGLPDKSRADELYPLGTVKLTSYTNFYDKDDDGIKEVLIVYVQPVDRQGDAVKAAGSVDVSLWDLGDDAARARLGAWHVNPDQLRENWFNTFMRTNYRLIFPLDGEVTDFDRPLTVRMSFTDYITGEVHQDQRVIEPQKD